jgi:transposase
LQAALEGRIQPHHRVLLHHIFAHLQFLESSMQRVLKEIEAQIEPYQAVVELLMTHPGVQAVAAMGFVSEVGIDLSRFPSAKHFASWIGVCPGNHTSAGKRKHGKTTKGNAYLRALLAEIVWGISHTKDNYLSAQYHRLARRIGKTKAIVAVSHTVAVNFYHMITKRLPYQELGANYFDTKDSRTAHETHGQTLRSLGL